MPLFLKVDFHFLVIIALQGLDHQLMSAQNKLLGFVLQYSFSAETL